MTGLGGFSGPTFLEPLGPMATNRLEDSSLQGATAADLILEVFILEEAFKRSSERFQFFSTCLKST